MNKKNRLLLVILAATAMALGGGRASAAWPVAAPRVAAPSIEAPRSNQTVGPGNLRSAVDAQSPTVSPADLAGPSLAVISGKVLGAEDTFASAVPSGTGDQTPAVDAIYTVWRIMPDRILKEGGGIRRGEPILVAVEGGTLGGMSYAVDPAISFQDGEQVVLFLGDQPVGSDYSRRTFSVVCGGAGKYLLENGGTARSALTGYPIPVADLELDISLYQ